MEIRAGIPAECRRAAAELYWEAFGRKLEPAIGPREQGVAIIEQNLNLDGAVGALEDGELLGLAGFHLGDDQFTDVKLRQVFRAFGLVRGIWRSLLLALLDRSPKTGELLMDGIVVRADQRGKGIGTKLLTAITEIASSNGLQTVRLDVVDTNPGARRLYERVGFVARKRVRTPYLRRLMGFGAATEMILHLRAGDFRAPAARGNRSGRPCDDA